jgi:hypothetical protein
MRAAFGNDLVGRCLRVQARLTASRAAAHDDVAVLRLDFYLLAIYEAGRPGNVHRDPDGKVFAPFSNN